jgi:hypothetical protein
MKLGQDMFKSKGEKKSKDEIENKWIKKKGEGGIRQKKGSNKK